MATIPGSCLLSLVNGPTKHLDLLNALLVHAVSITVPCLSVLLTHYNPSMLLVEFLYLLTAVYLGINCVNILASCLHKDVVFPVLHSVIHCHQIVLEVREVVAVCRLKVVLGSIGVQIHTRGWSHQLLCCVLLLYGGWVFEFTSIELGYLNHVLRVLLFLLLQVGLGSYRRGWRPGWVMLKVTLFALRRLVHRVLLVHKIL
jgi:hypothetical protein